MDGWMDGEVLIIGMMVGWSGGVPKGLVSSNSRWVAVITEPGFFEFFFDADLFRFFHFWWILGGVGRPKRRRKSSIGRFCVDIFFRVRFGIVFLGNLGGSEP